MRTIYQAVPAIVCAHAQSRKYSTQEKQLNYVNIAENRNETFIKAQNASTEKTHITRNIGAGVKLIRVALQCSCFPFWIFPNCIYIYMNMHLPNCSKHKPMPKSHESQLLNMIQACM